MTLTSNKHRIAWFSKIYCHLQGELSFWENKEIFTFPPWDSRNDICHDLYAIFGICIIVGDNNYICFFVSHTTHFRTFEHISFAWRTKRKNDSSLCDIFDIRQCIIKRIWRVCKVDKIVYATMRYLLHTTCHAL